MAWSPRRGPVERMVSMPTRPKPAVGSVRGSVYSSSPRGAHQPYPQQSAAQVSPRSYIRGVEKPVPSRSTMPWRGGGPGVRSHSAEALGAGASRATSSRSPRGKPTASGLRSSERLDQVGVEILCEASSSPRPRYSAVNGVTRSASAVVPRPKNASPRSTGGGGRSATIRVATAASPVAVSTARSEPRLPESPRDQMRNSPGGEGSAEDDNVPSSGGLEQILLERIAALEAQVVDRHGLVAKINRQQEQLDRLESLAKENAVLKAQVAKAGKPAVPTRGAARRRAGQTALTPWSPGPGAVSPTQKARAGPELRIAMAPQRAVPGRTVAKVMPPQFTEIKGPGRHIAVPAVPLVPPVPPG